MRKFGQIKNKKVSTKENYISVKMYLKMNNYVAYLRYNEEPR